MSAPLPADDRWSPAVVTDVNDVNDPGVDDPAVDAPPIEGTAGEDDPVPDAPPAETPVGQVPVEEAPLSETPVEEAPVEEAPVGPIVVRVPRAEAGQAVVDTGGWERLPSGRWAVGDPGSGPDFPVRPSTKVQARPDLVSDWASHGEVAFQMASIRGLGHFEDGKPRQDSCALTFTPDRAWLVGCVADGVSAATLSHAAADIAVDTIPRLVAASLPEAAQQPTAETWPVVAAALDWQAAVDTASAQIVERCTEVFATKYRRDQDTEALGRLDEHGLSHRDAAQLMATTAVVFVVGTSFNDEGLVPFAVVVAAGDSSALVLSDRVWHPITHVKNDGAEIASSAVRPLPRTVTVEPVVGFLESGQALAVISDGIGDPLGNGGGVVGRFLADRWSTPPDPLAFPNDLAFFRRTFTDDRTAALVWITGPTA